MKLLTSITIYFLFVGYISCNKEVTTLKTPIQYGKPVKADTTKN